MGVRVCHRPGWPRFLLGLSDRQAAEAVRCRIDFKYALTLDLDDPASTTVCWGISATARPGTTGPMACSISPWPS
ncbi:transposase [Streptomyces phaeochromogenes]